MNTVRNIKVIQVEEFGFNLPLMTSDGYYILLRETDCVGHGIAVAYSYSKGKVTKLRSAHYDWASVEASIGRLRSFIHTLQPIPGGLI